MARESHRYLLVRFFAGGHISGKTVQESVQRSVEEMLGQFGSVELKARMISFDDGERKAVFRCNSRSLEKLRAALALMTHMDGCPVAALVLRSSGTIKGLKVPVPRVRK